MDNKLQIYGDIVFNAKPDAVPYNYRISYKVSQLCLIMHICGRGNSCSLMSQQNMDKLIDFSERTDESVVVRFDPAVNRALTYSAAYGFISQQPNGNYKLTKQGQNLAERVKLAEDLMTNEIRLLTALSKKLTETRIKELIDVWRDRHAEDQ